MSALDHGRPVDLCCRRAGAARGRAYAGENGRGRGRGGSPTEDDRCPGREGRRLSVLPGRVDPGGDDSGVHLSLRRLEPRGLAGAQYHLPFAKPPKATKPTSKMMSPSRTLHTSITTMPTMTRTPPRPIPPVLPPLPRSTAIVYLLEWILIRSS